MNHANIRMEPVPAGGRIARADRNGGRPSNGPAVQVVHAAVPGRVRLTVPGLKHDAEEARRVEAAASTWPGIRRASASAATGNLLLEFDPGQATTEQLVAQARRWGEPRRAGASTGSRARQAGRLDGRNAAEAGPVNSAAASPRAVAAGEASTSIPAELLTALETAPVPPRPPLRARELEAALGAAALIGAGALLLAVRTHGHKLALDQAPLALAQEVHNPALTAFMRGASRLAEPALLWPVTLGATVLGVGRQRPGDFPWLSPIAVGGGVTLISILKVFLRRARPAAFEHLVSARGYSLPSGHAFLAATLYGLLAHHGLRWLRARRPDDRYAAAALLGISTAAILLVGISRVYLGVHYPTDVIAGYALALLWLLFLAAINDRPRPALGGA